MRHRRAGVRWRAAGWLAIGVMIGAAGVALPSGARPPGPPGGGRGHGPPPLDRVLQEHAESLGLAPEVEAEIREISGASRAEGEAIRRSLHETHDALRAMLGSESPDEAEVMSLADEIGALETQAHKSRLRAMLRIRALLTPEQRRALVEINEKRRGRHRRGPPPGGPPGPER